MLNLNECCREASIDAYDKYGLSPLMQAAQKGYVEYEISLTTYVCNICTAVEIRIVIILIIIQSL